MSLRYVQFSGAQAHQAWGDAQQADADSRNAVLYAEQAVANADKAYENLLQAEAAADQAFDDTYQALDNAAQALPDAAQAVLDAQQTYGDAWKTYADVLQALPNAYQAHANAAQAGADAAQAYADAWQAFANAERQRQTPIRASELFDAYDDNPIAADRKYKGKVFTVYGTVDRIEHDYVNLDYYMLLNDKGVNCYFSEGSLDAVARISTGERIYVRGTIQGRDDRFDPVEIYPCTVR